MTRSDALFNSVSLIQGFQVSSLVQRRAPTAAGAWHPARHTSQGLGDHRTTVVGLAAAAGGQSRSGCGSASEPESQDNRYGIRAIKCVTFGIKRQIKLWNVD